jgi:hypothetical protein
MSTATLGWLIWGAVFLLWGLGGFSIWEIYQYRRHHGGTLTETTERASRRYKTVKYGSMFGFALFGFGFLIAGIHVHTGLF